jgi:integrase
MSHRSKRSKPPSYRLHKPSGKAVVTLPDGQGGRKDVYLGPYASPQSRQEYARIVIAWESQQQPLFPLETANLPDLTINELILTYFKREVETYYVKAGTPTSTQHGIRAAFRFLKAKCGHLRAVDFGPVLLQEVRESMIGPRVKILEKTDPVTGDVRRVERELRPLTRKTVNDYVAYLVKMFEWAVAQELLPVEVHQRLVCVGRLKAGRTAARETKRVGPVKDDLVEQTLEHLPCVVADMIRVQRLTGCRPGEVVQLRRSELDMSDSVWAFRPARHKTEHRGKHRIIFIGPKAQKILRKYFTSELAAPLFRPDESERLRNAQRSADRELPQWPSHTAEARRERATQERGHAPARPPGECYTGQSYAKAIARACKRAALPHWAPNQLRHAAGTAVRKRFGLDGSQVVLGHATANVSEIYAEVDADEARKIMAKIG